MNSRQLHHAPAHVRSYELFAVLRLAHPGLSFDEVMAEVDERLEAEELEAYENGELAAYERGLSSPGELAYDSMRAGL